MQIYNTMTKKKEIFEPHEKNKVRIYVCGPTVYDYIHIGNARPMIVFDTFRRYLEFLSYEVIYVSNFTDIDDKIIKKANDSNMTTKEITEKYIRECKTDMENLNIEEATYNPLATEEVDSMIEFISNLISKGYAYKVEDGTVYFDTSKSVEYGKLSHKNIDELKSGYREIKITGEDNKKNRNDFVLWKPMKEGEPYYDSPFGKGRPGWHTECCVMAPKYCGGVLDVHAGGEDLIFPHHENEIAQFEALFEKPYSKYWMHNAFLNINNEKMSKSLGNFFIVRDVLNKFDGNVLRLFMLSTHYRTKLNFSFELMESAKSAYERIKNCVNNIKFLILNSGNSVVPINLKEKIFYNKDEFNEYLNDIKLCDDFNENEKEVINKVIEHIEKYFKSLDDDLNTADAISEIYEVVRIANQNLKDNDELIYMLFLYDIIGMMLTILGIEIVEDRDIDIDVEKYIEERNEAKKNKDYKKADEIRDFLLTKGIELEDTRQGVKWRKI